MKTGRRSKDSSISDNFNLDKKGSLNKKALSRAAEIAKNQQIATEEKKLRAAEEEERKVEKENGTEARDRDHEKSALQMLADMRWVYRQVAGRKKLKDLMTSDAEFKFLVKELMRIEAAILSAQIRKDGPKETGNQTTFVILQGLEDEKRFGVREITDTDRQVSILLNPDGSESENVH